MTLSTPTFTPYFAPIMAKAPPLKLPPSALAIKMRRVELGLSQEALAARTQEGKVPKDKSMLSQRTVSDLEKGNVQLGDLSALRLFSLTQALQWSAHELVKATGIDLPGFTSDKVTRIDMPRNARMIPVYAHVSGGMVTGTRG